jgi:hypothetical protein
MSPEGYCNSSSPYPEVFRGRVGIRLLIHRERIPYVQSILPEQPRSVRTRKTTRPVRIMSHPLHPNSYYRPPRLLDIEIEPTHQLKWDSRFLAKREHISLLRRCLSSYRLGCFSRWRPPNWCRVYHSTWKNNASTRRPAPPKPILGPAITCYRDQYTLNYATIAALYTAHS